MVIPTNSFSSAKSHNNSVCEGTKETILLGVIFAVIIGAVSGVRRQLKAALNESSDADEKSYLQEFKAWAWKNKIYVGIVSLILVFSLRYISIFALPPKDSLKQINYEKSNPSIGCCVCFCL